MEKISHPAALLPVFIWLSLSEMLAQGCYYKHLQGTIGKAPVTLQLHGNGLLGYYDGDVYRESESFSGTYSYDKYQEPIPLYGNRTAAGMIELQEYYGDVNTGKFSGSLDTAGRFTGVWESADGNRHLPFALAETYPEGSMSFDMYCHSDSMLLFEGAASSPRATVSLNMLWPRNQTSAAAAYLRKALPAAMFGDSITAVIRNAEMAFQYDRNAFFQSYRADMSEISRFDSMVMEYPYMYSYDQESSLRVVWNERNRLSVGYDVYLYSGGAHGNYGTGYLTYDLKKLKVLKLDDVFVPGFEESLSAELEKAVRHKYQIGEDQPLSEMLFEDAISFNENFYLTGKGITFVYVPYEIAAYALGQIELFIPFAAVSQWLQPGIAE